VCSCFFNLSGAVIAKCVIIDRSFFQHLNTQVASAISNPSRTVARMKSTSVPRDDCVDQECGSGAEKGVKDVRQIGCGKGRGSGILS
jgi:hypothetical protein